MNNILGGMIMSATKILVVEDEGLTAMELQRKLRYWGYDVPTFAFSSKEAVQKAEKIQPDLVLMDIVLKGEGDGIDAAQKIKDLFDIPIIYLTAHVDEQTRERAEGTNPYAYLIKPFEENELHQKIEEALYNHKAEKKLVQSGEWIDKKLKNSGVIVTDNNGRVRFLNDTAVIITGLNRSDALFRDISQVFPISTIKKAEKSDNYLNNLINVYSTESERTTLINPENEEIQIKYNITPIEDDGGKILGVNLIFEDVSQKVKSEEALLESEKWFRGIFKQSPLALAVYDSVGKLMDANSACLELWNADDIDELMDSELFKNFEISEEEYKILNSGNTVNYQIELDLGDKNTGLDYKKTDSGQTFFEVLISTIHLDDSGKRYIFQFRDVTAHKIIEQTLQKTCDDYQDVLESIDSGVVVLDSELNSKFLNQSAISLSPLPAPEVKERRIGNIFPFLSDDEVHKTLKTALESQLPQKLTKKCTVNHEDLYLELDIFTSLSGLNIILNDVTQQKVQENQLKSSEFLYRSIIEEQNDIVCRFTPEAKLTFNNPAYNRYFGEQPSGSPVFSISGSEQDKFMGMMDSLNAEKPVTIFEGPLEVADGDLRWWQWVVKAIFNADDVISEYQAIGREITIHKEKEEALEAQLHHLDMELEKSHSEFKVVKNTLESEIEQIKSKDEQLEKTRDELQKKLQEKSDELSETKTSFNEQLKSLEKRETEQINLNRKLKAELKTLRAEFTNSWEEFEAELALQKQSELEIEEKYHQLEMELQRTSLRLKETVSKFNNTIENKNKVISDKKLELKRLEESYQFKIRALKEKDLQSREALEKREEVLKDLYHRFRNNVNMISSLNSLQSEYMMDQMVKQFQENRNHMKAIALVHQKLYQSPDLENIDFEEYIQSLTSYVMRSSGVRGVTIEIDAPEVSVDMDTAIMCGMIVNELVSNSLKHAFPLLQEGAIRIQAQRDANELSITVADDGVGLPDYFDLEKAESLGIKLVNTFIEQVSGKININSGVGTEFQIKIPLKSPMDQVVNSNKNIAKSAK
jgi:PAS domain S-box-containing protein